MKKIISLALAIILCLSLCLPVLADGEDAGYVMLAGENSKWTKGSKESILAAASGLYDDLSAVYMDGKPIDESSVDLFPTAIAVDGDETSNATAGAVIGFRAANTTTAIPAALQEIRGDIPELIRQNDNIASPIKGIVLYGLLPIAEGNGQQADLVTLRTVQMLPLLPSAGHDIASGIEDRIIDIKGVEIKIAGASAVNGGDDEANVIMAIPMIAVRLIHTESENAKRILQLAAYGTGENLFAPIGYEVIAFDPMEDEIKNNEAAQQFQYEPGTGMITILTPLYGDNVFHPASSGSIYVTAPKELAVQPAQTGMLSGATGGVIALSMENLSKAPELPHTILADDNLVVATAIETYLKMEPEIIANLTAGGASENIFIGIAIARTTENGGEVITPEALGFTGIELKPEYLETLSVGKHTLTFEYKDGKTVSTEIEILAEENPETGDNMTALWISLCAVAAIIGTVIIKKKAK